MKTMKQALIVELKRGYLTPIMALERCACLSLSQRCGELRRDGYKVLDKWVKLNGGKRVKSYRIVGAQ